MPEAQVNGVRLHYELQGDGEPLALVHGSWGDATGWTLVVPLLAESFRVLAYDRRGHSRSERPDTQGSVHEDGDDLAALLEELELAPAHVVAGSYGGNIALRLACRRPELFRSLSCHEPPLWGLLDEGSDVLAPRIASIEAVGRRLAEGDFEGAARQFADEVAFRPGAWDHRLPPEAKQTMVRNAPTYLDELRDPDLIAADEEALARLEVPVRLTRGAAGQPVFAATIERLASLIPGCSTETIEGTAHLPQLEAPERFVQVVMAPPERPGAASPSASPP